MPDTVLGSEDAEVRKIKTGSLASLSLRLKWKRVLSPICPSTEMSSHKFRVLIKVLSGKERHGVSESI